MILVRLMLIATVALACWSLVVFTIVAPGGWIVALIVVACMVVRRGYQLTAFGTARWATAADLQGMNKGLIVGRMDSRPGFVSGVKALFTPSVSSEDACQQFFRKRTDLVRLSKAVHTAVFAPTGVGKGVSCVIPHLLTCPDSTVVVDFKGENALKTAEYRERNFGHRIVLMDPFGVMRENSKKHRIKYFNRPSDTFNPLDFINPKSPVVLDECRDLADALVVRTGQEKDPHWVDSAEVWIAAMTAAVVHFGEGSDRSVQAVRTLLSDPAKMQAIIKLMQESDAWDGMLARLGNQLTHFVDKELGSTLTTTNRFMRFLDTLAIADSTKSSSFNPADLCKGKMTVYLILPPEHMRAQSPLLRMWIGAMLRAVVRGGLQEKAKVHFVLDEAASLGHMEALDDAVDKYRGYGVRLQFYYQSLGQLKKCFPDGQDQTLLSNTSQVFFGVNDQPTAEYVGARLGEETIVVDSGGTNSGTSSQSGEHGQRSYNHSSGQSSNWSQMAHKLLKPEQVMALDERTAITFTPGVPPIRTRLIRYYESDFRQRGLGRAFSGFRMFVTAAVLLFMALAVVMSIVGAVVEKNNRRSYSVDDPLQGIEFRSFEKR